MHSSGASTFLLMKKTERKKFFACGSNAYGQLGLGHNRNVTVPEEIPTPAAEGFILTDVQRVHSIFLTCKMLKERKSFLLVVIIDLVS